MLVFTKFVMFPVSLPTLFWVYFVTFLLVWKSNSSLSPSSLFKITEGKSVWYCSFVVFPPFLLASHWDLVAFGYDSFWFIGHWGPCLLNSCQVNKVTINGWDVSAHSTCQHPGSHLEVYVKILCMDYFLTFTIKNPGLLTNLVALSLKYLSYKVLDEGFSYSGRVFCSNWRS